MDEVYGTRLATVLEGLLAPADSSTFTSMPYARRGPDQGRYPEFLPLAKIDPDLAESIAAALGSFPDGLGTVELPLSPGTKVVPLSSVLTTAVAADPGLIQRDPLETVRTLRELVARLPQSAGPFSVLSHYVGLFGEHLARYPLSDLFVTNYLAGRSGIRSWIDDYRRLTHNPGPDFHIELAFAVVATADIPPNQRASAVAALHILARYPSNPNQGSARMPPSTAADYRYFQIGLEALGSTDDRTDAPPTHRLAALAAALMPQVFGRSPAPTEDAATRLRDVALILAPQCAADPGIFARCIDLATAAEDIRRRLVDPQSSREMLLLVADE